MDLTGRFPFCYLLIGYHYDANAILGVPLRNRQTVTITKGWQHLHSQYSKAGVAPSTWIRDNETSIELKTAMEKRKVAFQLVPPHNHRANAAERAIQTFKNHFKAGLFLIPIFLPVNGTDYSPKFFLLSIYFERHEQTQNSLLKHT